MEQYIKKSDIIAEIEKLKAYLQISNVQLEAIERVISLAKIDMCNEILSFLDTLEVKEEIEIPINKEKIKEIDNRIERQYKNMIQKLKEANYKTKDFSMNN